MTTTANQHNLDNNRDDDDYNTVKESVIRKMTRLATEYQAVNLSQGKCCKRYYGCCLYYYFC